MFSFVLLSLIAAETIVAHHVRIVQGSLSTQGESSRLLTPRFSRDERDNCGFGQVNGSNWRDLGIDAWLSQYIKNKTTLDDGVVRALAKQYAPNVAESAIVCDTDKSCSPISCELMDLNEPDVQKAFYVLEAVANLNTFFTNSIDGIQQAQNLANSLTDTWIDLFSVVPLVAREIEQQRFLIDLLTAIFSFVLSFFGLPGAIASGAVNAIGQGISEGLGGDPPEKFDAAADLGAYIGELSNASVTAIVNLREGLVLGQSDPEGNGLPQYLANGSFVDTVTVKAQVISSFIQKQYIAASITAIWRSQKTYIVAAPTRSGVPCSDDARGPKESKLCLDDDNGTMVYYAYMIAPTFSANTQYPQVRLPYGWDKVSNFAPLDLQQAVAASVKAYRVGKFNYEAIRQQRWIGGIRNNTAAASGAEGNSSKLSSTILLEEGYAAEGMFTIPVCWSNDGNSLTPIKTDKHRRYPCQCIHPYSSPYSDPSQPEDETIPFLYSAGMAHDKVWFGFCNDANIGQNCHGIQGTVNGSLDVATQNNTFETCEKDGSILNRPANAGSSISNASVIGGLRWLRKKGEEAGTWLQATRTGNALAVALALYLGYTWKGPGEEGGFGLMTLLLPTVVFWGLMRE